MQKASTTKRLSPGICVQRISFGRNPTRKRFPRRVSARGKIWSDRERRTIISGGLYELPAQRRLSRFDRRNRDFNDQLGETLSPLEPVKDRINFIKGLHNQAAIGVGIHPGMTGNLLSGAPLTKGAELHGGISMDQVLAARIGDQTVQPSMVLGCEQPVTGYHETNFSMAYSSHITWQTPTS